ncbi:MAG: HPF/RaiA family ribosome-associated protein [Candidatus Latescibacteria bacterium]|nr:HPF/RaiA family ribosome-associated protein [bacterium]MBD3424315.1 HPF/RaiA family ribosome-associated protein [Candidatus Latescibacterota bacterium]
MEIPIEISFRGVEKTPGLEELIRVSSEELDKVCGNLISCRVAVEKPQEHQKSGNPYRVRIDMRVPPGHELVVKSSPGDKPMHQSLNTVITETFEAARRRLRKLTEQMQETAGKHPGEEDTAFVARLFRNEGYGFIRALDGDEYYFHRNSVLYDDFERLEPGTVVRFASEKGEKGPQASTVEIIEKPAGGIGG